MSQFIGRTNLAHAKAWHHIDIAKDTRAFGRIATSIAITLMGKHKPVYHPSNDCGDFVVVTNCQYLIATGKKMDHKMYRWHSGRIGNLHEISMRDLIERKGGGEVLRKAVSGMLPKNKLRQIRLDRLRTFEASDNPYQGNILATYDMVPDIEELHEKKLHEEKTEGEKEEEKA